MTHHVPPGAAVDLSELALDIIRQAQPADMVRRVPELATKLVDCAAADLVRVTDGGQLRIVASSDPGLSELTGNAWRQWPHIPVPSDEAVDRNAMQLQRNRYLRQMRADTDIVQEQIFALRAGSADHGFLRFLFTKAVPVPAGHSLIGAFCAHAAIALDRAALLDQVQNLSSALEGNRIIGAAIGVLMTRHQLTYDDGFRRLQVASQDLNRKLRDIAAEVLYTGQLPNYRGRSETLSPLRQPKSM